jgi:hypothetical protein
MVEVTMNPTARLKDMTREDVLVLADQAKDRGLGIADLDPKGETQLAYLCYVSEVLEAAFATAFPCLLVEVRAFNRYGGRFTYLFEEAALLAVLTAFGLDPARLERHLHGWNGGTYVRVVRERAKPA